jgi:hypothetical protein
MGGLTAFVLYSVEVVPEQVELLEDSVKTLGGGSDRSSAGAATVLAAAAAAEKRSVVTAVVVVISLVSSVTSSDSFSNGSVWRATAAESCGESCCCVPASLSLPEDVVVVISVSITSNIVKSDLPLGPRVSVKRKPEERHKQGRTQDWRPNGVHFAKSTNHVQIAGPS